jgi:hypothetical protein
MNKTIQVLGGLLALIGGVMSLIAYNTISWGLNDGIGTMTIYLTLMAAVVAILGGILALVGKKIGGVLPLIVGIVGLLGQFILIPTGGGFDWPMVYTMPFPGGSEGMWLDPILMIIGGILSLYPVKSK